MKALSISRETEDLFRKLQILYNERNISVGAHDKSINRRRIILLEAHIDDHCYHEYNIPWFRLYSQWMVKHDYHLPDLLF